MLRRVIRRYRQPVRDALAAAGMADIPQAAVWALTALAIPASSARDLVQRMSVSKQAVAQLVDLLVDGGYVDRLPCPSDRRRRLLELTARGRHALEVIEAATGTVDAAMAERLGADRLAQLYAMVRELDDC